MTNAQAALIAAAMFCAAADAPSTEEVFDLTLEWTEALIDIDTLGVARLAGARKAAEVTP